MCGLAGIFSYADQALPVDAPELTLYNNILAFEPGTWLTLHRGGHRESGTFEPVEDMLFPQSTVPPVPGASLSGREVLLDSVRHHLIADVPEVFRDGLEGRLVTYGDTDELEEALVRLHADPQHTVQIGNAGRHRFETDYKFSTFSSRWQNLLTQSGELHA